MVYAQVVDAQGHWLEVLGGGVLLPEIVAEAAAAAAAANAAAAAKATAAAGLAAGDIPAAWAMGLGLDRLSMCGCCLGDIRVLMRNHPLLLEQYKDGVMRSMKPFSTLPPVSPTTFFLFVKAKNAAVPG